MQDDGLPTLNGVGGEQSSTLPMWITSTADASKTFYINSAADLKQLADEVNGANATADSKSGKTYILTKDIDLSAYANDNDGEGWTPIGTYVDGTANDKPFAGVFDGQNHTITGLKIYSSYNYRGLFGIARGVNNAKKAQIKNVIVKNASVRGVTYVGAMVGSYGNEYTEALTGCAMQGGSVHGVGNYVGGVAGEVKSVSIFGCYATGSVSGKYSTGGVVGIAEKDVANCYATGNVSVTASFVGGVVSQVTAGSVTNCYATGNVSGISFVGGVVGQGGVSITGCVALGRVMSGTGTDYNRVVGGTGTDGTIGGCYAWSGMTVNGEKVTTDAEKVMSKPHGADLSYTSEALNVPFKTIFGDDAFGDGNAWCDNGNNKLPTLKNVGGTQSSALPLWITNTDTTGNTFYIYDAADLKQLADEVNGTGVDADSKSGKTYKLANDIDLSAYADDESGKGWTPIGTDTKPFAGIFNGQNHTIKGLKIARSEVDYQGLFGYVKGASNAAKAQIKNVVVKDVHISGDGFVGTVVGFYGDDCDVLADCAMVGGSVTGADTNVGGIVGQSKMSEIKECYATGTVIGDGNTGGIVGVTLNANAKVIQCYTTGDVSGPHDVGGVAGYATGDVENCYTTGDVVGTGGNTGGVVGHASANVEYCYSTGNVSSQMSTVGGVAGHCSSNITNCVALGQKVSAAGSVNRVSATGKTFSGCYAWSDMAVKVGVNEAGPVYDGEANNSNGANLASSNGLLYTEDGAFGWTGFDGDGADAVWELRNTTAGKLPKLIGTADDPVMNLAQTATNKKEFRIKFSHTAGTGGTALVDAILGMPMPSISKPTRNGYTLVGYFDTNQATGGTMYYDANAASARNWDRASGGVNLYARWMDASAASASIFDVEISGVKGTDLTTPQTITLSLTGTAFNIISKDVDVSDWFTASNLPVGLSAKIAEDVVAGALSATITISGIPTVDKSASIAITIPAARLASNADLAVTPNANAKWKIDAEPAAEDDTPKPGIPGVVLDVTTQGSVAEAASSGSAIVAAGRLNVRSGAGLGFSILGKLTRGDTVAVQAIQNGWAKIAYQQSTGYVSTTYLDQLTLGMASSTGKVLCRMLNVRDLPSTQGEVVGQLPRGTVLTFDSFRDGWGRIAGTQTWVCLKYIG